MPSIAGAQQRSDSGAAARPDDRVLADSADALPAAHEFRLSDSPGHLLRRAEQFASEAFSHKKVTLRQSEVLAAIAEGESRSQSDLVRSTGIDRSTLADIVKRLEKNGLISRTVAEGDGRARTVVLTRLGAETLEAVRPELQKVDDALLNVLPKGKRGAFVKILTEIARAASVNGVAVEDEAETGRKSKKQKKSAKAEKVAKGKAKDGAKAKAKDKRGKRKRK
jgi:DNA-binding MarR family transcriptional regulator